MLPQAASDFLHRFNLAPHRAGTPLIQELDGPARADVLPESLEVFPQQVAADALQIVFEQLRECDRLLVGEMLASLEQAPARVLQHRLVAIPLRRPASARRTSSNASFIFFMMWKRSKTCTACGSSLAMTFRSLAIR